MLPATAETALLLSCSPRRPVLEAKVKKTPCREPPPWPSREYFDWCSPRFGPSRCVSGPVDGHEDRKLLRQRHTFTVRRAGSKWCQKGRSNPLIVDCVGNPIALRIETADVKPYADALPHDHSSLPPGIAILHYPLGFHGSQVGIPGSISLTLPTSSAAVNGLGKI